MIDPPPGVKAPCRQSIRRIDVESRFFVGLVFSYQFKAVGLYESDPVLQAMDLPNTTSQSRRVPPGIQTTPVLSGLHQAGPSGHNATSLHPVSHDSLKCLLSNVLGRLVQSRSHIFKRQIKTKNLFREPLRLPVQNYAPNRCNSRVKLGEDYVLGQSLKG